MATALQMITRSMRLAKVIGKGETLDADEATDGLYALNAMLDSWQTERLFVYQIQSDSFTWTATQSRTVGVLGSFAMALPARIDESSYFTLNSVDYPVNFLTQEQWAAIPSKSTTSTQPSSLYVEYGTALHTLYAYPVPSASLTFVLRSWQLLQTFAATTTDLALPLGYQRAIEYSLAEEFGPEFGKEVTLDVKKKANQARKNIKRINLPKMELATETGLVTVGSGFNIYSG